MKTYEPDYIDRCRTQLDDQLALFDELARTAGGDAVDKFSTRFFANLVVVLDAFFVHRLRAVEGKDGNPLNEVRMLAESIIGHDGVLAANATIKYKPDNTVLGIAVGDPIRLDRAGFERLADAYFEAMHDKYT
ncbi:MAG: hypothetical protein AB7Q42_08405 [Acidimicrobiia bacterium]